MAYSTEMYLASRESRLRAQKRYYERNRAKILAKQKAYDDAHRNEIRERHKKAAARVEID